MQSSACYVAEFTHFFFFVSSLFSIIFFNLHFHRSVSLRRIGKSENFYRSPPLATNVVVYVVFCCSVLVDTTFISLRLSVGCGRTALVHSICHYITIILRHYNSLFYLRVRAIYIYCHYINILGGV